MTNPRSPEFGNVISPPVEANGVETMENSPMPNPQAMGKPMSPMSNALPMPTQPQVFMSKTPPEQRRPDTEGAKRKSIAVVAEI